MAKKTKVPKTVKKKSKKWIGVLVALFLVFGLFGGTDETSTEDANTKDAIVEEVVDAEVVEDEIVETLVEEEPAVEESIDEVVEEAEVISSLMEEPVEEVAEIDKSTPAPASELEPEPTLAPEPETQSEPQQQSTGGGYAVNGKNGKIHIVGQCPATGNGDSAMEKPVYFNTYEEAEAYSVQYHSKQKKRQCGNCW